MYFMYCLTQSIIEKRLLLFSRASPKGYSAILFHKVYKYMSILCGICNAAFAWILASDSAFSLVFVWFLLFLHLFVGPSLCLYIYMSLSLPPLFLSVCQSFSISPPPFSIHLSLLFSPLSFPLPTYQPYYLPLYSGYLSETFSFLDENNLYSLMQRVCNVSTTQHLLPTRQMPEPSWAWCDSNSFPKDVSVYVYVSIEINTNTNAHCVNVSTLSYRIVVTAPINAFKLNQ